MGSIAAASLLRPAAAARVAGEVARPRSPYEALLRDIEPRHDDFPREKEAFEIAAPSQEPHAVKVAAPRAGISRHFSHAGALRPRGGRRVAGRIRTCDTTFEPGLKKRRLPRAGPPLSGVVPAGQRPSVVRDGEDSSRRGPLDARPPLFRAGTGSRAGFRRRAGRIGRGGRGRRQPAEGARAF
jgi:hypothetical protein